MSKGPWMAMGGLLAGLLVSATTERRAARTLAHERRRVAADLHDLVMQDLSLALANARALTNDGAGPRRAELVVSAGERALAGARGIVSELAGREQRECEPIVRAIQTSAQAAARSTRVIFDAEGVPCSARPDRPTREALVHVAREAVRNATKHADGNAIEVRLQYDGEWRLTVRDEGAGLDAEQNGNGGFGLHSMLAQVQALGGVLNVRSAGELGTTVEAVLP
jgi:signal transduction histidine kinase